MLDVARLVAARRRGVAVGRLIVSPSFVSSRGREVFAVPPGVPLARILADVAQARDLPVEVVDHLEVQTGDGQVVAPDRWDSWIPTPGETVLVYCKPAGGGFKQIAGLIAAVVVAVFAWWAAPLLAPTLGISSTFGIAGLQAGLTMVGQLAVGALFKPSTPTLSTDTSSTYSLGGQSNEARPYGAVPRIYGRRRVAPAVVGVPRSIIRGGVQYLQAVYVVGYGPLLIEEMRAGQTPFGSIRGARAVVHEAFKAGDPLSLYLGDTAVAQVGVTFENFGEWVASATAARAREASVNLAWGSGLINFNPKTGGERNARTRIHVQARDLDAGGEWVGLGAFPVVVDVDSRFLGYWREGADAVVFEARSSKLLQAAITLRFPNAARWEIRATQTDARREDGTQYDRATWGALQSFADGAPLAPKKPVCVIEIEVPASEQAQSTLQLLTVVATSKLRTFDGANLTEPVATRSPAWVYLDILTGTANPRPLDVSRVDLATLRAWALACDARAVNADEPRAVCDFVADRTATVWETMRVPLGCGRAAYTMRDGLHSVLMDEAERLPVQVFTEANARNFAASRDYYEPPHALRVQFVDPASDWQTREVVVYDDGQSEATATRFETLTFEGITRASQAWRDGRYFFAQGKLRRERVTLETDIENLAVTRGDLVLIAHDVLQVGGVPSYVVAVPSPDSLRISQPMAGATVAGLGVRVRRPDAVLPVVGVVAIDDDGALIRTDAPHGAEPGDLVVVGVRGREVAEYLVAGIEARAELSAVLSLIEYAPAVYAADAGPMPPYVPSISGRPTTDPVGQVRALTANVSLYYVDGRPYADVVLSWIAPATPGVVRYDVARQVGGEWVGVESTTETRATFGPVARLSLVADVVFSFRVQAIRRDGARSSAFVSATVSPDREGPAAPLDLVAEWVAGSISARWGASTSPDVREYRARLKNATGAVLATLAGDFRDCVFDPVPAGDYVVEVFGVDFAGNVGQVATAPVAVPLPGNVASLAIAIRPRDVRATWPRVETPGVADYVLTATGPGGAKIEGRPVDVLFDFPPLAAGAWSFEIRARNQFGQVSAAPATASVVILAPRATRISATAVANTAFLRWGSLSGLPSWNAETSHAVAFYEMSRGRISTFDADRVALGIAPATVFASTVQPYAARQVARIEKFAGEFAYLDESMPGVWRYSVRAVDVAGNRAPWEFVDVHLQAPDDYELLDSVDDLLPECTFANGFHAGDGEAAGDLLAPVDIAATWREHFEREGWQSPADQIAAGFPFYSQPGAAGAVLSWEFDYARPLPALRIVFEPVARILAPAPLMTFEIFTAGDGDFESRGQFPDAVDYLMPNGTRRVRVELAVESGADRRGLLWLRALAYRLEVKYISDEGIADIPAEGARVAFRAPFIDVRTVQLTIGQVDGQVAAFARYVVDADQSGMMVYCLDATGNFTAGRVAWFAKGV